MPTTPPKNPPPLPLDDVPDTTPGAPGLDGEADRTQPMSAIPPSGSSELRTAEGRRFVITWDALSNILELSSRIAADDPTPPRGGRASVVRIHRADLVQLVRALSIYLDGDELDALVTSLHDARGVPRPPMGRPR